MKGLLVITLCNIVTFLSALSMSAISRWCHISSHQNNCHYWWWQQRNYFKSISHIVITMVSTNSAMVTYLPAVSTISYLGHWDLQSVKSSSSSSSSTSWSPSWCWRDDHHHHQVDLSVWCSQLRTRSQSELTLSASLPPSLTSWRWWLWAWWRWFLQRRLSS